MFWRLEWCVSWQESCSQLKLIWYDCWVWCWYCYQLYHSSSSATLSASTPLLPSSSLAPLSPLSPFQLLEYQMDVRSCKFDREVDPCPPCRSAHHSWAVGESDRDRHSSRSTLKCFRAVGGPATVAMGWTIRLTHRSGATHRSWVVGAPARWAGVNFPTGINPAHRFRPYIADKSAL